MCIRDSQYYARELFLQQFVVDGGCQCPLAATIPSERRISPRHFVQLCGLIVTLCIDAAGWNVPGHGFLYQHDAHATAQPPGVALRSSLEPGRSDDCFPDEHAEPPGAA